MHIISLCLGFLKPNLPLSTFQLSPTELIPKSAWTCAPLIGCKEDPCCVSFNHSTSQVESQTTTNSNSNSNSNNNHNNTCDNGYKICLDTFLNSPQLRTPHLNENKSMYPDCDRIKMSRDSNKTQLPNQLASMISRVFPLKPTSPPESQCGWSSHVRKHDRSHCEKEWKNTGKSVE